MKIAIIGCGWLGFPLAKELLKTGHFIYGSTTSINNFDMLEAASIQPFLYDGFENKKITIPVNDVDCLIINFPPSKSFDYPIQIEQLTQQFPETCKIIFTSSTSVYEDIEAKINEKGSIKIDNSVYQAELKLRKLNNPLTILRLAGLIGTNRHPIKHLTGKIIENGNMAVNLVHQQDVIAAIDLIIEKNAFCKTYNLCWHEHPKKGEYYINAAGKFNVSAPIVNYSALKGKIIDGGLFTRELEFQYKNTI